MGSRKSPHGIAKVGREVNTQRVLSLGEGKWLYFGRRPFECPSRTDKVSSVALVGRLPDRCKRCFRVVVGHYWGGGKRNVRGLVEIVNTYIKASKASIGGEISRNVTVLYFGTKETMEEFYNALRGDLRRLGIDASAWWTRGCRPIRERYPQFFKSSKELKRGRVLKEAKVGEPLRATGVRIPPTKPTPSFAHLEFMTKKLEGEVPVEKEVVKPAAMRKVAKAMKRVKPVRKLGRVGAYPTGRPKPPTPVGRKLVGTGRAEIEKPAPVAAPPNARRRGGKKALEAAGRRQGPYKRWLGFRFTWAGYRRGFEGLLVLFGLSVLVYGFVQAYILMGSIPDPASSVWLAFIIALGVLPAMFVLRGADSKVRAAGGNMFAATGLGLLVYCTLTTYNRIGVTPHLGSVWLFIMIAISGFTTMRGVSLVRDELGLDDRKVWGNVLAAAGFAVLLLFVFAVHGQVGRAPQLGNLLWLGVVIGLGLFLMREGFPMAREYRDRTRRVWGGVFLGTAVLIAVYSLLRANELGSRAIETVNGAWLAVLIAVLSFLLLVGLRWVRE